MCAVDFILSREEHDQCVKRVAEATALQANDNGGRHDATESAPPQTVTAHVRAMA